jgi:hypothetical protein
LKVDLDGHLENWYLRLREHDKHRHPCTMVEASPAVHVAGDSGVFEQTGNAPRKTGRTTRRVLDTVQLRWETGEIVYSHHLFRRVDGRDRRRLVGRNA